MLKILNALTPYDLLKLDFFDSNDCDSVFAIVPFSKANANLA